MKVLIICQSVHHGNTGKIAAAMADELGATLVKPSQVDVESLAQYDLIGFGSGIYHHSHHRELLDLTERLPPGDKQVFIFSTRGYPRPLPDRQEDHRNMREKLEDRGFRVTGEFSCKGWSTFSGMRLLGGINKGSPGEAELAKARTFARSLETGRSSKTTIIDSGADKLSRVFFLQGRKTVIIDSGRPGRHEAILRALTENDIKKSDVSLLLFTHGHGDHLGGALELKEALGIPVAMSETDAAYVSRGLNAPLCPTSFMTRITTAIVGPKTRPFQADVLLKGEVNLSEYGVDAVVFPTPGHTAGSLSVAVGDSCITGDLLTGKYFVTGGPSTARLAEVPEAIVPSMRAVLAKKPSRIYPSHGIPWDAEQVRRLLSRMSG